MGVLLRKELRLALHPMNLGFIALSALLLVPSYPYYVTFFYTTLGIFMMFQTARENHDIPYMMMLPIQKRDMVKARFLLVVVIEALQVLCCLPFLFLRSLYAQTNNAVGIEANWAFLGLSLVLLGIFNLIYLPGFYKTAFKAGGPFLLSSIVFFVLLVVAEGLEWMLPGLHAVGELSVTQDVLRQLPVLLIGIAAFALLTLWAYRRSVRRFEILDI